MFTSLHSHSSYSALDSLVNIKELITRTKQLGMTSCALTDHGNIAGAIEFYTECKKQRIKPILGIEIYCQDSIKRANEEKDRRFHHITILAESNEGWANIVKLTTLANQNFYYKPRIDFDILKDFSGGLIVLTGCLASPVSSFLYDRCDKEHPEVVVQKADPEKAETNLKRLIEAVNPGNLYVEIQDGGMDVQPIVNRYLREFAKKYSLPRVVTLDTHYIYEEDAEAHDYLKQIAYGSKVMSADSGSGFGTKAYFLRGFKFDDGDLECGQFRPDNLTGFLGKNNNKIPDYLPDEIREAGKIAERCNVELDLDTVKLPEFSEDAPEQLRKLAFDGLKRLGFDNDPKYIERANYELGIIEKLGFADYFLIVEDIVKFGKLKGIRFGYGRGSVTGSLVSYCLSITNVNPFDYDLVFERFLHEGRSGSLPDCDIDVDRARRDEIIEYIKDKYGRNRVAQIATFGRLTCKAALKDVMKVAGVPFAEANLITSLIPSKDDDHSNMTIEKALQKVPALKEHEKKYPKIFAIAKRLEGCVKTIGKHAAGVLISDKSFSVGSVPLVRPAGGDSENLICGWDLNTIDKLKMLKIDFLGLNTLSVIEECLSLILKHKNIKLDIDNVSLDNELAYDLIGSGKTIGVFQLETDLGSNTAKRIKPKNIEECCATISLIRPGSAESGNLENYIKIRRGEMEPFYIHESLRPILEHQQGIYLYQENLLAICNKIGGLTLQEADSYRKIIGKKLIGEVAKAKDRLVKAFINHSGMTIEQAESLWVWFEKSAGYNFSKNHGIPYAMLSYKTAYLKAHYPVEFYCANLTMSQYLSDSLDEISKLVNDAKSFNIKIIPPVIGMSEQGVDFSVLNNNTIAFGLSHIKGFGNQVAESVSKIGKKSSTFYEFYCECSKNKVTKSQISTLIKLDTLSKFGSSHTLMREFTLLEMLTPKEMRDYEGGPINEYISSICSEDNIKQRKNNGKFVPNVSRRSKLRNSLSSLHIMPIDFVQKLGYEKFYLGITLSGSEADLYSKMCDKTNNCREIIDLDDNIETSVCVIIEDIREIIVKNGKSAGLPMAFVKGSDSSYTLDSIIVFPRQYEVYKEVLTEGRIVKIKGKTSRRSLIVDKIEVLK